MTEQTQRELRRQNAIDSAVRTADSIILESSDGSTEETNYLTAQVAKRFVEKAIIPFGSDLLRIDISKIGQGK